jgi:hypothetical protein
MMAAVFLFLFIAFALAWFGRTGLAKASLAICFVLATGLFLWEIWSPEYGFEMPWLQG